MRDLFRRKPLQQFSEYSSSHLHAGKAYQARFNQRPGRAAMWELEKLLIKDIFQNLAPHRALDFATGTGRIAAEVEQHLPNCVFYGIDISHDMLATARNNCKRVTFCAMDGRQALEEFGRESFDVVSAFRFFPNADPALRQDIAEEISGLTKPGGYVVLNNHRNFWSIPYMAMRAAGNGDGNYGTPAADIKNLFLGRGFLLEKKYSLGVWPQTDYRSLGLSWPMTSALERFNMHYLSTMHNLGYNTIYIFKKEEPK